MDRRLISFFLTLLLLSTLFSCDPSLQSDVQGKIIHDKVESGEIPSFRLSYFGNGSNEGSTPVDETKYITGDLAVVKGNISDLTRSGYVFTGWNSSADGSGKGYAAGDSIKIETSDIKLYAVWKADTFTITFDKNDPDAVGDMAEQQIVYGTSEYLSDCVFTKTDYTLMGWATTPGGSVVYKDEASFTMGAKDLVLYACWKEGISISFEKGYDTAAAPGDITEMDFMVVSKNSTNPLDECDFTRTGYSFKGWDGNEDGSWDYGDTAQYAIGSLPVVLTAVWEANSYSLTLDPDGGSGGMVAVTTVFDSAMPAQDDSGNSFSVPLKEGYTFSGYYSQKNREGYKYYNSAVSNARSWNIAEDTTLYAGWTPNTYVVSLAKDGGSGGDSTITATYNQPLPLATPPGKPGYVFKGYYSDSDVQYYNEFMEPQAVWSTAGPGTLYARWEAFQSLVALISQGNTPIPASYFEVQATHDEYLPQQDINGDSLSAPEYPGYTFKGYFESEDGLGTMYYDENMSHINPMCQRWWNPALRDHSSIFAWWEAVEYRVTLSDQSGFGLNTDVFATYGQSLPYTYGGVSLRPGYNFLGYYEYDDLNKGRQYYDKNMNPVGVWEQESDGTIYAHWEAVEYQVTLSDPQNPEGNTQYVMATYGQPLPYAYMGAPSRLGYNFMGYYEYDDDLNKGRQYYDENMNPVELWEHESDGTIYAHWEAVEYQVTLFDQSGFAYDTSVFATYGQSLPYPGMGAPSRPGYNFMGYYEYDDDLNKGRQYYDENMNPVELWEHESDGTIYAHWEAVEYQVTLFDQSGFAYETSVFATSGQPLPYAAMGAPSRPGYIFLGYFENEFGNGKQYYDGAMYPFEPWDKESSGTIYAHWEPE